MKDGGQAFPVPGLSNLPNGDFIHPSGGLTKREWYAGLAMQGMLSNVKLRGMLKRTTGADPLPEFAETAFDIARAMLAESEKV